MTMTLNSVITLEENSSNSYLKITSLILKILDNIIKSPFNVDYRHINLSNEQVSTALISGIGAMECLFELGFQEGDYSLYLPLCASLDDLIDHRNEISLRRNRYLSTRGLDTSSETSNLYHPALQVTMNPIIQKIFHFFKSVLIYEDSELQKTAKEIIPLESLEIAAERHMRQIQLMSKKDGKQDDISIQELLLMELVSWFKNSFFSWVDSPNCAICNRPTKFLKMSDRPSDLLESKTTELHECSDCGGFITPFHRYSDPRKLLHTRKGRCGEWASCFTLLCLSLGFDARLVYDVTDHLWTEVYILAKKPRWVHIDPCEGVIDAPLMYECGWGKKLSHILCFSLEGVQDVTWRYTLQSPEELILRRQKSGLSEGDLISTILILRQERYKNFSIPKQKYLTLRTASELADFLWTPNKRESEVNEKEKQGRISGALSWRLARSELGSESFEPYVWKLSEVEKVSQQLIVKYSAASDKYVRILGSKKTEINGWRNGLFENVSLFRKEEVDWKMAYLARKEGTEEGSMKMKFDLSSGGLAVSSISILCKSAVFESGKVSCILSGGDIRTRIPTGEDIHPFETTVLEGAKSFTLEMKLSGGNGSCAWQHAQLFRQPLNQTEHFPFEICINLK